MLKSIKAGTLAESFHTECMITLIAIAVPVAVMGVVDALAAKYGAETRPGFDERTPIR
jgi:hypothetical protein